MQTIIEQMIAAMDAIKADINKVENKAAAGRARKLSLELEKLGKEFRKVSISEMK